MQQQIMKIFFKQCEWNSWPPPLFPSFAKKDKSSVIWDTCISDDIFNDSNNVFLKMFTDFIAWYQNG